MKNSTPIEQLLNLDEILPISENMQSMDGYPKVPNVNNNYLEQMGQELNERQLSQDKLSSRIRKDIKNIPSQYMISSGMNNKSETNYNPYMHTMRDVRDTRDTRDTRDLRDMRDVKELNESYVDNNVNSYNQVNPDNYRLGPKAYQYQKQSSNNYSMLTENYQGNGNDHFNNFRNLNCIEIAEHIRHCPICSKFYENDKTIYVIVIIILLIICIILLKKLIENYGNK